MHQHLLSCNEFALYLCASLQPNSRLWHPETVISPKGGNGFNAVSLGYLLAARLQDARGVVRPIDGLTIDSLQGMVGSGYTGEIKTPATSACDGMLGFA